MSLLKKLRGNILLIACLLLFFAGCHKSSKPRQIQHAFYYWKTEFGLDGNERKRLSELEIQKLYIRFFDVDINTNYDPIPVAKVFFDSLPPANIEIVPVVFITNKTITQIHPGKI